LSVEEAVSVMVPETRALREGEVQDTAGGMVSRTYCLKVATRIWPYIVPV
jgi:hypothetical protein